MIRQTKIEAFTMVDVLTGMVITSIIISMVFYLFMSLNKQVADYGQIRNQINTYLLLKTDLKRQFETANEIIGIPGGIELTNQIETIEYRKEDKLFLRKLNGLTDTLSYNISQLDFTFRKDNKGNLTNNIKEMDVKIDINNQYLSCHFYKDYSLKGQINKQLLNEL